jgi:hypothetical protein
MSSHFALTMLDHRYQAQVTLLTSILRPLHGPQLEIGTVDGMQGREKDAVIISLVRSNETVCLEKVHASSYLKFSTERSRIFEGQEKIEW